MSTQLDFCWTELTEIEILRENGEGNNRFTVCFDVISRPTRAPLKIISLGISPHLGPSPPALSASSDLPEGFLTAPAAQRGLCGWGSNYS